MIKPDFKNSIVNLTSSILATFGQTNNYSPLPELADLDNSQNIILLVIDGLGYEYVKNNGQNSFLLKNLIKPITSVFPATTAVALTTLETGLPPQEHGITGWFMFLKELGVVSTILPFTPRYNKKTFINDEISKKDIFIKPKITSQIKSPTFTIYPEKLMSDGVNKAVTNTVTYKTLNEMLGQINTAVLSSKKRKYIYAYWTRFDTVCHQTGCTSQHAKKHFDQLDKKIANLAKSLTGTNSTIIVTADHGFVDTPPEKIINLEQHPQLVETLSLPLCGDSRVAYCYLHPAKVEQFKKYVKKELAFCCDVYKSEDLIQQHFFGLGHKQHPKLIDRIGDYVLIMKENYIIRDKVLKEEKGDLIGHHSGVSRAEMYVPLIVVKV